MNSDPEVLYTVPDNSWETMTEQELRACVKSVAQITLPKLEAEIELLQARVLEFIDINISDRQLITKLADALEEKHRQDRWEGDGECDHCLTLDSLLKQAREATKSI